MSLSESDSLARLAAMMLESDPAHVRQPQAGAAAAELAMALALRLGCPAEAARAAAWRCIHLFRQGDFGATDQAAEDALARLAGTSLIDERCETLRVKAMANCERGAFGKALSAAQSLSVEAETAASPGWSLMAAYALGACYDRLGDSWQAARVLQEALTLHGPNASPRQRLIGHLGMSAFLGDGFHRMHGAVPQGEALWQLRQALPHAEAAVELLEQAGEPLFEVAAKGNLAEVLLYLGHPDRAEPLLASAMGLAADYGLQAHRLRTEATWGAWLLRVGRAEEARELAVQHLSRSQHGVAPTTLIRIRETAYRACERLGRPDEAFKHLAAFELLERQRTLAELRALGELFVTRGEALKLSRRAEELERQATHDPLTGLANRSLLRQHGHRSAPGDVVAMIDIDHFKRINDVYGHAAGDAVLVDLARLLRQATRSSDLAARLGGEEFVLFLTGVGIDAAREVCERLRRMVADARNWTELPDHERVTVSIGLAAVGSSSIDQALRRADVSLYQAKECGRNRIVVSHDVEAAGER